MDLNKVILVGRIASDIKFTPKEGEKGSARAQFTLATNRMRSEEADYLPCVVWGKIAERVAEYCTKGKEVGIEGNLRTSGKKNTTTGEWTNYWSVNCTVVSFGRDSKKQQTTGSTSSAPLETDMTKLAAQLVAEHKAKQARSSFDEDKLRQDLVAAGITEEAVINELITKYKAQHGLDQAAPSSPGLREQEASDEDLRLLEAPRAEVYEDSALPF